MTSDSKTNSYEDFLLAEYDNVAQAHFKSIETISNFFRYYLLLMSVPVTIAGILYRVGMGDYSLARMATPNQPLLPMALLVVSLVGLGVFAYVINLRLDVVLYARSVNAIRKHFYDKEETYTDLKLRFRVLPQSPSLPAYTEKSFFWPVVFVFAVLNSGYLLLALLVSSADIDKIIESLGRLFRSPIIGNIPPWSVIGGVVIMFFIFHFFVYLWYARHRETAYLRSNIIGVDIDGVLNTHRDHFCQFLRFCTGKELSPERIVIIPVHEDRTSCVTREDERSVFNEPRYWTEMPVLGDASEVLRKLRNAFKMKIFIFTYRPWPDSQDRSILVKQKAQFWRACNTHHFPIGPLSWLFSRTTLKPIKRITTEWLHKHKIPYDRLIVEAGNDYSSDPFIHFKNRFYVSRKKKIRYFVEDDAEKAAKLSFICDVVFLISHPYNEAREELDHDLKSVREGLPSNVLRVKDWAEIYRNIRRFS